MGGEGDILIPIGIGRTRNVAEPVVEQNIVLSHHTVDGYHILGEVLNDVCNTCQVVRAMCHFVFKDETEHAFPLLDELGKTRFVGVISREKLVVDACEGMVRVIRRNVGASRLSADPSGFAQSEVCLKCCQPADPRCAWPMEGGTYRVAVLVSKVTDVVDIVPVGKVAKERVKGADETRQ